MMSVSRFYIYFNT